MYFWRFADAGATFGPEMIGVLDYKLSVLALFIAIMGALVMLPSIERMRTATTRRARLLWLASGSVAMAFGIWGMHFTAMLAFTLPVPVTYDLGITIVSILPAVAGCALALTISVRSPASRSRTPTAALALALGIGAMHYSGMEAMRASAMMQYDPQIFVLSILIAYILAAAALYVVYGLQKRLPDRALPILLGSSIIGLAVTGMHFAAASATHFYPNAEASTIGLGVSPHNLAYVIAIVCLLVIGIFLVSTVVDRHLFSISSSLRETEVSYRNVVTTMLDAHITIDGRGRILTFNPAAESMFGYSAEEVLKKNVGMLMNQPYADNHNQYIHAANKEGFDRVTSRNREIEAGGRRKNNEVFSIELQTNEFEADKGRIYSAVIRDIDERRRNEEKNNMLAAIVENTAENIVILNREGNVRYINPAFAKYADADHSGQTKLNTKQVLNKLPAEFGDVSKRSVYDAVSKAIQTEKFWLGSVHTDLNDGSIREEEIAVSPVRDSRGNVSYFVVVIRDVTEQKSRERQLNQAQKLESIGQLAAGIAHEINTPMQYVGDNTRFLQDAVGDYGVLIDKLVGLTANGDASIPADAIQQALDDADIAYLTKECPRAIAQSLEGVSRVSKIVLAMKEFSHPAQDKRSVDLNKAIESTIVVATNEWKYVAEMDMNFDPALPPVVCQPGDINQVILNLIVNASHAIADVVDGASESKGTISVSTGQVEDAVEIRIADTGGGMPKEVQARIFDPFFTTKGVGKGTGQGLSIAHTLIVDKHGGTITVDSEPGRGTCFTIRLPLDDASSVDATAAA